jgi:N-acylneuraminate cytidylyltransferase
MIVALIPARGGSKRIPNKNVRPFLGKPIISYSIEAARACGLFDRIIVSTDSEAVAQVARAHGAETPFLRPAELADDHTGTGAVVRHGLRWLVAEGAELTYACCIYATAPFLTAAVLRAGFERLKASTFQYAFSVTSFPFPVERALHLEADGAVRPIWPDKMPLRSQDLAPAYHDAGQFYWGRARAFLDEVPLASSAALALVLPRHRVQDIDTPEDWHYAELLYRAQSTPTRTTEDPPP